jgi:spiro-SPASM protein
MKFLFPNPSLIAIYLNEFTIDMIQNKTIDSYFIQLFLNKLNKVFLDLPIYSNFKFHDTVLEIQKDDEKSFLYEVSLKLPSSQSLDPDIDEIYLAFLTGINPLLSVHITNIIIERHKKYFSQYSYSENIPKGIIPTLISREFLSTIPDNLKISIHDFLLKNINNYDTEILFFEPDLRKYRLDFSSSNLESIQLTKSFLNIKEDLDYNEIENLIKYNSDLLRFSPKYIEVELIDNCDFKCTFCPRSIEEYTNKNTNFEIETYYKIIEELENNFKSNYTISLSGFGEPLLYPHLNQIIEHTLNQKYLTEIIIETSLSPDTSELENLLKTLSHSQKSKLVLIINFSSIKVDTYSSLYQTKNDTFPLIFQKIKNFQQLLNYSNLYVQMLKIKEVENEIEEYFNLFEKENIQVILQKYNSFVNKLPEKRVSDLTPIQKDFCWHLARDLFIRANGEVKICKQVNHSIGNIKIESLKEIWDKNSKRFEKSIHLRYSELDTPCINCDEWYTFNA